MNYINNFDCLKRYNAFLLLSFTTPASEWSEKSQNIYSIHRFVTDFLTLNDGNKEDQIKNEFFFDVIRVCSIPMPKKYRDTIYYSTFLINQLALISFEKNYELNKILKQCFNSFHTIYLISNSCLLASVINPSKTLKCFSTSMHALCLIRNGMGHFREFKKRENHRLHIGPALTHFIASGVFANRAYTIMRS